MSKLDFGSVIHPGSNNYVSNYILYHACRLVPNYMGWMDGWMDGWVDR